MTTAVFSEQPQQQVIPEPQDLVGEGKKYATVDDALKALSHSQAHIQRLEAEAAARREQESADAKFDALVEKLAQRQGEPQQLETPREQPPVVAPVKEDLAKLVREVAQQDREQDRISRNVTEVAEELIRIFGDESKANQAVTTKARELGVSVEFLQSVAAQSPKAFFAQVGVTQSPVGSPGPSTGSVNLPVSHLAEKDKPGTYSFYQKMLKEDPKTYFKPQTQIQMQKDGLKFGPGWTET